MITIGPAREPERAVVARLLAEAGLPVDGLEHTWLLVARDDPAEAAAGKPTGEGDLIRVDDVSYRTDVSFNMASLAVVAILVALYAVFW